VTVVDALTLTCQLGAASLEALHKRPPWELAGDAHIGSEQQTPLADTG